MLPPLLDKAIMEALLKEHRDIEKQMGQVKSVVEETRIEGLSQTEVLARKSRIQGAINTIRQALEEHASKEDTILKMVKSSLESISTGQGKKA